MKSTLPVRCDRAAPVSITGAWRAPFLLLCFWLLVCQLPCHGDEPKPAYPRLGDCVAGDSLTWRSLSRQSNQGNPWGDCGVSVYQRVREANIKDLRVFLAKTWHSSSYLTRKNDRGDQLLHCALDPRGHPDEIRTPELDNARLEMVGLLIKMGADVNAPNDRRETPLQLAVLDGNEAIVRRLLKEGAVLNGSYAPGEHPVQLAVARGDIPVTALLMDAGADINPEKYEVDLGDPPFELAVRNANLPMVEYLLERMAKGGVKPEWAMWSLSDPLVKHPLPVPIPESRAKDAVDRLTLARMLLKAGASPNNVHAAAAGNHTEIAKLLLDAGGDPNVPNESLSMEQGRTPLHDASCHANLEIVNALLAKGATVFASSNARRFQALHYAIRPISTLSMGLQNPWQASDAQRVEVARALLKAGANPKALANDKWTPLHEAASAGNLEMVRLLLDAGADPNAVNERGIRPLHLDAFPNGLAIAKLLIERGAATDVGLVPEIGIIHRAASRGDIDLVAFYLEKGVRVDLTAGGFRYQPVHDAAEAGQVEMVEFLLGHGAKIDAPTLPGCNRSIWRQAAAGSNWCGSSSIAERIGTPRTVTAKHRSTGRRPKGKPRAWPRWKTTSPGRHLANSHREPSRVP
ncbi:MAG: ankyrin repeat domain-containing protein [Verrucomicrobiota bacterium]